MNPLRLYPDFLISSCSAAVESKGYRLSFYPKTKSVFHNIYKAKPCSYHKEVIEPFKPETSH
jgi:hypothetical protein